MSLLDIIREIFGNGKKNANLITRDLVKVYGENDQLEAALYENNVPLADKNIRFNVNGRDYDRKTDGDGIARLNINLAPGEYTPLIGFQNDEYNIVTAFAKIIVKSKTRMEGTDINMTEKDGTKYHCAVYDTFGRVAGNVKITVNGVPYIRNCDATGLYKLNLNLKPGTYNITAEFLGDDYHLPSKVTNKIVINPKPEPKPEPVELHPYITDQGPGELGQRTGYTCGPHSLMQCIYRCTGIELSEMELAAICGTTSDGTDHDGLATGLAWFNHKYGYNLKMAWKNFSEVGFDGTQQAIENGACFHHILYRNEWGHYEVPKWTGGNPIYVLNSLGGSCGGGYCGYVEERSKGTHQSYINGISQKSVCIITP